MSFIKNFNEFLNENFVQEQRKMLEEFYEKFNKSRLPQDFEQIFPVFIDCVNAVQKQAQTDNWEKYYMSPFHDVDVRLIQKRENSIYTGEIIKEEVKYFLEKNIELFNEYQQANELKGLSYIRLTFIWLAEKFLKERTRIDIPQSRVKNIFNMVKKVTGFSNLKIEGNTIYAMNKDADWRGPKPRGSVVKGTWGDTAAWYVEVHKDSISVDGDIELKPHLGIIYGKICTVLSGEVDKHNGKPFYQIFAQFEDGSEFLIDGENMGTSEEYVNGGRISGTSTSKDQEIIDLLIDFVENAGKEDLKTLPDNKRT